MKNEMLIGRVSWGIGRVFVLIVVSIEFRFEMMKFVYLKMLRSLRLL